MAQLDDDERELILWRHFERLTAHDAAQLLGITVAAASQRYIRTLERLREALRDWEYRAQESESAAAREPVRGAVRRRYCRFSRTELVTTRYTPELLAIRLSYL